MRRDQPAHTAPARADPPRWRLGPDLTGPGSLPAPAQDAPRPPRPCSRLRQDGIPSAAASPRIGERARPFQRPALSAVVQRRPRAECQASSLRWSSRSVTPRGPGHKLPIRNGRESRRRRSCTQILAWGALSRSTHPPLTVAQISGYASSHDCRVNCGLRSADRRVRRSTAIWEHSGCGALLTAGRCPPGSWWTAMRSSRRRAGPAPAASKMRAAPDPRILTGWSGASPHVLRFPPRAFLWFPVCPPGSPPSPAFPWFPFVRRLLTA